MKIRCVVAATSTVGPDFFGCEITCTEAQYDNGEHYECAADLACDAGYDSTCVVFDENDGPPWLFAAVFDTVAVEARADIRDD